TVPAAAGLDELVVRIGRLRILVEVLHIRVGRRGVEVEVVFLYVLAVVRLTVRQPEQPLLQNWVFAVPQGERETQQLPIVRDPRQPVLAPSVGPRAGLLMTEVVPRVAGLAVVLSHRSPLPLAQVGPPLLPRCRAGSSLLQSLLLSTHSL